MFVAVPDISAKVRALEAVADVMRLSSVAIVVTSAGNNPQLLNPDFLSRNGIVPQDWQVTNVVVLPPVAQVHYANGLQFLLEQRKFQVKATSPDAVDWRSELPRMATIFLRTLPHVMYQAVGLNFELIETSENISDKGHALAERLLKDGDWLRGNGQADAQAIHLRYHAGDATLNLQIAVSPAADQFDVNANFHSDVKGDDAERFRYFTTIGARYEYLLLLLEKFPLR